MKQILIVDDSHVEQILLSGLLKKEYQVLEAGSGEEALEIFRTQYKSISAIILDIMLPGIDGFTVLTRLKSNALWRSIPVIVTTGIQDESTQVAALDSGANAFVTKPFNQALLLRMLRNTISLCETAAFANAAMKDRLTGLLTRDAFFIEAEKLIHQQKPGYYMLSCFDIDNFKVINDQHGTDIGDEVLCHVADCLARCAELNDSIVCRQMADCFAALYPATHVDTAAVKKLHRDMVAPKCIEREITIRIGRYLVDNLELSVSVMYDRASLAQEAIKGRYDVYIAQFDESIRERLLSEQQIVTEMRGALKSGQFEPWFQPQYNHVTGELIGSEALVRWRKPDGTLVSPGQFIPVFERNGFIYDLDKYMWEQVCSQLRRWLDEGRDPMPVSVNISRHDIFHKGFLGVVTGLVDKYALPIKLLRLEITESAFAESAQQIVAIVKELIAKGFTVEIDDFGSGYSSLNTLKDVPAQIIKLDLRFLASTDDTQRGGNILESVVRMSKWLGMTVIAEGVETREQADYLKSIGCNYIQGFYYAKPMPLADYEALTKNMRTQRELGELDMVKNFDNSAFWTPHSLDTLVFNHFSGGAFIFEFSGGKFEMLRVNDEFAKTMHSELTNEQILKLEPFASLNSEDNLQITHAVKHAFESGEAVTCELYSTIYCPPGKGEYVRFTVRRIASCEGRFLFYGYVENITEQREAVQRERASFSQMRAIMENVTGGVSAVRFEPDGSIGFSLTNDHFFEMCGYTKQEATLKKLDVLSLILPEDLPAIKKLIHEKLLGQRQPVCFEYRCVKKDGSIINVSCNSSIAQIEGVGDDVIVSVINDITTRKQAEEQQREANKQLRFLNTMSKALLTKADPEDAIINSMRMIMNYFGGDRVYIIEYEDGLANNTYEVCAKGVTPQKDNLQNIPLDSVPFWKTAFDSEAIISIDTDTLPPERQLERELLEMQDIHSLMGAPIYKNGSYSGFIGVDNPKQRQQQQCSMLLTLGDYAAVLLTRRDLVRRIRSEGRIVKAVMDGVPGGFCRYSIAPDGTLKELYCSDGYLSMLNMTHEQIDEITKGDMLKMVHADDIATVRCAIAQLSAGNEVNGLRYRICASGGKSYLTVSIYAKTDTDEQGNTFANIYYSDASELIAAEARQADLLDNLPCGAALYEYDGKSLTVKHLNYYYWTMVGRDRRQYEDSSFIDFVCPDDRIIIVQELGAAIRQKREFRADIRILCGDEAYHPFRITGNISKAAGKYLIYAAYTPLESNEMEVQSMLRLALHAMMDCSDDFSYVKDIHGRYVSVSNSVVHFLGFDSPESILGKSDAEIFGHKFAQCYAKDDGCVLSSGKVVLDREETVRGADGELRFISTSKYPLHDAFGKIIGLYGISRNTTLLHTARFELDALLHSIPSGVLKYSADDKAEIAYINRNLIESLGYSEQSFRDKFHNCFTEMIYSKDRAYACSEIERQEGSGGIGKFDYRIEAADGSLRWFHDEGVKVTDESAKQWYYVVLTDITMQKTTQSAARRSNEEFRLAVNASGITICRYDIAARTLTIPDSAVSKHGFNKELRPFPQCAISAGDIDEQSVKAFAEFFRDIRAGKPDGTLIYKRRLNGVWRWLEARSATAFSEDGKPESAVISLRDVTEQIDIRQRADTDPLTGLLNRTAFSQRMNELLKHAHEHTLYALLMLDIDHFKEINDVHGHSAGDEALIRFAQVLASCVRADDMVCRLGGDEFFVCLCGFSSMAAIENRAKHIFAQIGAAFARSLNVTASMGIAVGTRDGADFETLYHKADAALYHVKENGKNNFAFYSDDMRGKNGLRVRCDDDINSPA